MDEQLQSSVVSMAGSMERRGSYAVCACAASRAVRELTARGARVFYPRMAESKESANESGEKQPIGELVEKTALEVRKQPVKSVVWAFFIGILLTVFPVGRVIGALTGLVFALLRPALLLLGVVKLCEEIEERRK